MEDSPSEDDEGLAGLWAAQLGLAKVSSGPSGTSVWPTALRSIVRALKKKGLAMPTERSPIMQEFSREAKELCDFQDLLRIVWAPLAAFIDDASSSERLTGALRLNLEHLGNELSTYATHKGITTDDWLLKVKEHINTFGGCSVSTDHIKSLTWDIVPCRMEASAATAFVMLRTETIKRLVGNTLATMISECALAEASGSKKPQAPPDLYQRVRQDLIDTLAQQAVGETESLDEGDSDNAPAAKKSRTPESIELTRTHKTEQLQFLLTNKVGMCRSSGTVKAAVEFASSVCDWALDFQALEDALVNGDNLTRHMLLLDGALDRLSAEDIASSREAGTFAGVVIATDESPPGQPRFAGLRFQITMVYVGVFHPVEEWEASGADPPISSKVLVADILHCSSKRGEEVVGVLEKQIGRFGLSKADVVGGVGDGGGENEGKSGVHSSFEKETPSYVRRRCLPHLAWRVGDAAILVSTESEGVSIKTIAAHFADGVTWQRLRCIATKSKADGGLELFKDGSKACHDVFHCHPGATILSRPQSDIKFLHLLRGHEHVLFQCATEDLKTRDNLAESTQRAVADLGNLQKRIKRSILGEVLERCMYLMYHNSKHPNLAQEDTWEGMTEKFTQHIMSTEITDEVLKRFKTTQGNIDAKGWSSKAKTWVDLAILLVMDDDALYEAQLDEAFRYHKVITDRASSHLMVTAANIMRTSWLAAEILAKDARKARTSAIELVKHLASTPPLMRTSFEAYMFETSDLYHNLVEFAHADPPVRVWQGRGIFAVLFKFLAARFLTAPDNVLDCERMHGRWQWQCDFKRALKMHTLNATLKLTRYLELNGGFPPHAALVEHLDAERQELSWSVQDLSDNQDIATGWRYFCFKGPSTQSRGSNIALWEPLRFFNIMSKPTKRNFAVPLAP